MLTALAFAEPTVCPKHYGPVKEKKNRITKDVVNESLVYLKDVCGGGCSGALIGPGLILTAAHCTVNPATSTVHYSNGDTAEATLLRRGNWHGDTQDDWAVLQTKPSNRVSLKLACYIVFPSEGKDLTCGGKKWPKQQEYPVRFEGIHEQYAFHYEMQTTGPADYGDSGSPLLNAAGEIVGVGSALELSNPNVAYAVPLGPLKEGLKGLVECSGAH